MVTNPLEQILHPQSIAVIGASGTPTRSGYTFTAPLLRYGYQGKVYPVNPKYSEILGIKAYASLREIPGPVDYVISCVPAPAVLDMLEDCSQKGVKAVHLFTARFSETGRQEATELERKILKQARKWGIRLIGPNCMGVYYPRQGISFSEDFPKEPGLVGLAFQSGQGLAEFIRTAPLRGVRFSKAISYGNALDFNECDFLDYFSQDPETKIILMYVEGVRDGQRFLNSLRRAASTKPVIVIKGGRGNSGAKATASHTASIAGSMKTWETVIAQAGAISARNFDEMLDLAVAFYFLPVIRGSRVGVIGGSGGNGVLCADECEEAGLDVIPLPPDIREELRSEASPIWDWIGNPTDMSILDGFEFTGIDMLQMMARNDNFDLLITNVSEGPSFRKEERILKLKDELNGYTKIKKESLKPLIVVVKENSSDLDDHDYWRWKVLNEVRTKVLAANIPFYPTIGRAAKAARKLIDYYQNSDENSHG
ncbi:acetate--CoA ligase family protein [Chloroflexota bacterium]